MAHRFSKQTGTLTAVLAAVALAAAACSSDDTVVTEPAAEPATTVESTTTAAEPAGVDRAEAVDALIGMVEASGGTGGFFSDDEMRCWAEATVDAVGLEAFAELETLDPAALAGSGVEISGAEAMQDQDLWASCIDSRQWLRRLLAEGSDTETADCVADAASEQLAYDMMVAPALFDAPISLETEAEYFQLLTDCGVEGLG